MSGKRVSLPRTAKANYAYARLTSMKPNEPVIPGLYMSKSKAKQKSMISSENYERAYNTRKVHLSLCALVVPRLDPRRGLRHWRDDGRL